MAISDKRGLPKWTQGVLDEVKSPSFWKAIIGEFLASLLFIVLVCGVNFEWDTPSTSRVALSTGLGVAMLAHVFWEISGGHFNPAVSVAMTLVRRISPFRCFVYIIAQVAGCFAGSGIMYAVTPTALQGTFAAIGLAKDVTIAQAFVMEFILTCILIWTILRSTNPGNACPGYIAPLTIGLSVAVDLYIGIPYTGAAMNPLRSLGPALVRNIWKNHWIYWVSPILSAVFSVYSYQFLAKPPMARKSSTDKDPGITFSAVKLEERLSSVSGHSS